MYLRPLLRPGDVVLTLAKATPPVGLLIPQKQAFTNTIGFAKHHSRKPRPVGRGPQSLTIGVAAQINTPYAQLVFTQFAGIADLSAAPIGKLDLGFLKV